MGVDFHACIVYGLEIDLPKESGWDWIDNFNEDNFAVEIINVAPMDVSRYILFIKDSHISCGVDDQPIVFKMPSDLGISEPFWDTQLKRACDHADIQYIYPAWMFITYFS